MNSNLKKIWFPSKKFGWGWGLPVATEGWIVLGVYFAFVSLGLLGLLTRHISVTVYFIAFFLITMVLVVICYLRGESPK
ncbi:MAG: hypothetical protein AAF402_01670 [Pseudomonadota bacterium]